MILVNHHQRRTGPNLLPHLCLNDNAEPQQARQSVPPTKSPVRLSYAIFIACRLILAEHYTDTDVPRDPLASSAERGLDASEAEVKQTRALPHHRV